MVEPDVFEAPAVVDAVDHHRQPLHLRLPAGREAFVSYDRARPLLLQFLVDLPYQRLALLLVAFRRLLVEQLLDLPVAVSGPVALGAAGIVLVE